MRGGMAVIEKRSPTALSDDDHRVYETGLLAQALSGATPTEIQKHAQTIGNTIADDEGGIPASDDRSLDTLSHNVTDDNRVEIRGNLTQTVGEKFIAMIDERSVPRPEPDGSPDQRSATQIRADALEVLLDQAAVGAAMDTIGAPAHPDPADDPPPTGAIPRCCPGPDRSPKPPRDDCRAMGPSPRSSSTVKRCPPWRWGRERRLFPPHLRRAIIIRDQYCIKCGAPPSHTQCHHIEHWSDDGDTELDNGCMLCQRCHTQVHHNGWDIVMGFDRHPWLIPPADIDPPPPTPARL